jgi:hypothetical protein
MQRACCILLLIALIPQIALPRDAILCVCAAIQCHDCTGCCDRALFGQNGCGDSCASQKKTCCTRCAVKAPSIDENRPCRGCVVLAAHAHEIPKPQPHGDSSIPDALPVQETFVSTLGDVWESGGPAVRPAIHAPPDARRALPLLI